MVTRSVGGRCESSTRSAYGDLNLKTRLTTNMYKGGVYTRGRDVPGREDGRWSREND